MTEEARRRLLKDAAWSALFPAAIMLYTGFIVYSFDPANQPPLMASALVAKGIALRVGGVLLCIYAAGCLAGITKSLYLGVVVDFLSGLGLIYSGIAMSISGLRLEIIFAVVGAYLVHGAYTGLQTARAINRAGSAGAISTRGAETAAQPAHPASVRPSVMPLPDEPPPEEGYLARLARESDETARADHD